MCRLWRRIFISAFFSLIQGKFRVCQGNCFALKHCNSVLFWTLYVWATFCSSARRYIEEYYFQTLEISSWVFYFYLLVSFSLNRDLHIIKRMSEFELHFCPKYKCNKLLLNFTILFLLYVGHYHIILLSSTPKCCISHSHIHMYLWDSTSFLMGNLDFCVCSSVTFHTF